MRPVLWWSCVLGFMLSIPIGLLIWSAIVDASHDRDSNRRRCVANLKQIGLGYTLYQQKNGDRLPDRDGTSFVSALYETGHLEDPGVYLCPGSRQIDTAVLFLDETTCSYVGRRNSGAFRLTPGGLAREGARTPLVADRSADHHDGVRNVLFGDGHVETVQEGEYQARYASILGE